jgi:hypothetical protein
VAMALGIETQVIGFYMIIFRKIFENERKKNNNYN